MSGKNTARLVILLFVIGIALLAWFAWPSKQVGYEGYIPPPRTKTSGCAIRHALPDPACTPGAVDVRVTVEILCSRRTKEVRHTWRRITIDSFTAYGVSRDDGVAREDDHLISLELGGADNDIANHFPQAYEDPVALKDGKLSDDELGAHAKDKVENWLHRRVCAKELPLADAQRMIATNWVAAYHEYLERKPRKRPRKH